MSEYPPKKLPSAHMAPAHYSVAEALRFYAHRWTSYDSQYAVRIRRLWLEELADDAEFGRRP